MNFIIREANHNDREKLIDIANKGKYQELNGIIPNNKILSLDKDIYLMESFNNSKFFLAESNGKIIGFTGYEENLISFLVIDKEYYKRGIASALLRKNLAILGGKAWLIVAKENIKALTLYKKFNFKITKDSNGKYNDIEVDILRLAINPDLKSWK